MDMRLPSITRRQFVIGGTVAASAYWLPQASFGATSTRPRIVVFTLRGGLDGLHSVPPYAEPSYAPSRGGIAIPPPGTSGGAFKLDGLFGLHPAMPNLYAMYQAKQALIIHACAPPYHERSHFTAQDILENGTAVRTTTDGWMGRALKTRDGRTVPDTIEALAVGTYMTPLMLEGAPSAAGWQSKIVGISSNLAGAVKATYANDAQLAASYAYMPELDQLAIAAPQTLISWTDYANAGAALLSSSIGPDVLVFDLNGWDTHTYQGGSTGMLAGTLGKLDVMFGALKTGLGAAWSNTVMIALTEFGRTVQVNGTGGTDHGVGTAAYVLGGAVNGGRVVADWPGLDMAYRLDGRDLRPTTDTRSILKGVLRDHWHFSEAMLAEVFPDSATVPALNSLVLSSGTATQSSTLAPTSPTNDTTQLSAGMLTSYASNMVALAPAPSTTVQTSTASLQQAMPTRTDLTAYATALRGY